MSWGLEVQIKELQKENKRLRKALSIIIEFTNQHESWTTDQIFFIAQRALDNKE